MTFARPQTPALTDVVSKLLNHAGNTKTYDRYSADPEKTAAMERWVNRCARLSAGRSQITQPTTNLFLICSKETRR
jgi:hypothetical protein